MRIGEGYGNKLRLVDLSPAEIDVVKQALARLTRQPKALPCALLYDESGSALFEQITQVPECYPTRTEVAFLRANLADIQAAIAPCTRLVELGSGSATKTRILVSGLAVREYVPIEIARAQLIESAAAIAQDFPDLDRSAIRADYTQPLDLPERAEAATRTVVFFPGSTIGNFEPVEALSFLPRWRRLAGESIVTEHSYKYSVESFCALARGAGWSPRALWIDAEGLFSLHWLTTHAGSPTRTQR